MVGVLIIRSGSIPACAGEPPWSAPATPSKRVYPRVCGGTDIPALIDRLREGLSPRVRGNPISHIGAADTVRSIPACAGEPDRRTLGAGVLRVYPRVCGGTDGARSPHHLHQGLSPRVRGNRSNERQYKRLMRSIPACAGEPRSTPPAPPPWRVYPRVCGGTAYSTLDALTGGGSIPACAGEPAWSAASGAAMAVYPRVCGGTSPRR